MPVVHSGVWRPEDRAGTEYHYLPVEVPAGCRGLSVRLEYDRSAGVLDLGCVGPGGFHGWSGGARDSYVIAPGRSTPGYLPGDPDGGGALTPGGWWVALGLHRVPPEGLPYRVVCELGAAEPAAEPAAPPVPARPPRRELPAPDGMRWLAGDLHTHTVHSDGTLGIDGLAAHAAERGLDFLAVTDHNTVSHHPLLPAAGERAGVLLLPGQEVTTDVGHANAFGDIGWIDFRRPAETWVSEVAARGGLLSVNHPLGGDCCWRQPLPEHPPLAEIWHYSWLDGRWGGPLAWWQAWGWDTIPVGGSDFHDPGQGHPVGIPATWLLCEDHDGQADGVTAALDALRAGRVAIGGDIGDAAGGPLLLRLGDQAAGEFVALDADGLLLTDPSGRREPISGDRRVLPSRPGPHWLEDHENRLVALCR